VCPRECAVMVIHRHILRSPTCKNVETLSDISSQISRTVLGFAMPTAASSQTPTPARFRGL
jgi:hypothetical protein